MKTKLLLLTLIGCIALHTFSYSQWSAPVNISPGTTAVGTNENAGQCIAVSGDTIRIVYSDRSSAIVNVIFNQSCDNGITWGVPSILQSSLNCGFTAIANSGSNVHVVWMDSLGASRASYYKRSLDGGITWDSTICLDSVTKFWPGIACSGNLVIATLNKDLSGNTEVFIKRSLDNGSTWLPEQQISNAVNRSEDPAINILGNDVHLSWNDKRSGTMNIYYCHSSDNGATWGPETQLTTADSYTSMVCLDSTHVDVPLGIRSVNYFDVWLAESADTGNTWIPNQQLTNTSAIGEIYPFMVRDGLNIHIVYLGSGGGYYLYSGDGGINWDMPVFLSASGQPFIAYTGCVLHVIFSNAGYINYMRNPTGNCIPSDIENATSPVNRLAIYPNPVSEELHVLHFKSSDKIAEVIIFNTTGEKIIDKKISQYNHDEINLDMKSILPGIYFYEVRCMSGLCKNGKLVKE